MKGRVALACALLCLLPAVARAQTETVEYYALDAVGSVRVVFDATGNIIGRMDYGPFGQELFAGTGMPDRRYAGLFRDGEAGLDSAGARSYQVRTGRFSTVDPIYGGLFEPQRWNRYSYALNSPTTLVDPDGLQVYAAETVTVRAEDPFMNMSTVLAFLLNWGGGGGAAGTGGAGMGGSGQGGRGVNLGRTGADGSTGNNEGSNSSSTTTTGGPGNPPGPNPKPDDCRTYSAGMTMTVTGRPSQAFVSPAFEGASLMYRGYADAFKNANTRGFKPALVATQQGNDVYRHVDFMSGAVLSGNPVAGAALIASDVKGIWDGRAQSAIELIDDFHGLITGAALAYGALTGDSVRTYRWITRTLCISGK